ncbi:hypothetical protein RCK87_25125, partial [Salmonella enterica subsp. enterica serovar 1,4,[5],12:i:-]
MAKRGEIPGLDDSFVDKTVENLAADRGGAFGSRDHRPKRRLQLAFRPFDLGQRGWLVVATRQSGMVGSDGALCQIGLARARRP